MSELQRIVTIIPAKPIAEQEAMKRKLQVAAYCRVSTEEEEQQSSYEAQCSYYTDKIMTNPEWTMAGIFADEGITGTSTKKRDDFNRMIRKCKKGKINLILTKSISRFARNTLDTIKYTRMLRAMGIGIYFEKENINTLDMDSEMLITMLGAFAQAESESISRNVAWGKRKAMLDGKVFVNFNQLYGYYLDEDGSPGINEDEASVVRFMYSQYLYGGSLRIIRDKLDEAGVPNLKGEPGWSISTIKSILTNERYCGDVLGQKTYTESVIGGKSRKNNGELPQVLIQNNHPGIVSREVFYAVQEEMKRRTAARSPSTKSATGRTSYASKYALSERLVCGECGTLYRRCTWNIRGKKKIVWRCVSRLDHGTKYCKQSPTMEETVLQTAIMESINTSMDSKGKLVQDITDGIILMLKPKENAEVTLGEVKRRIKELNAEFYRLFDEEDSEKTHEDRFSEITKELADLKRQQEEIAAQLRNNQGVQNRMNRLTSATERMEHHLTQWDEEIVRQMIHMVEVISADRIRVVLTDGTVIMQEVHNQ